MHALHVLSNSRWHAMNSICAVSSKIESTRTRRLAQAFRALLLQQRTIATITAIKAIEPRMVTTPMMANFLTSMLLGVVKWSWLMLWLGMVGMVAEARF